MSRRPRHHCHICVASLELLQIERDVTDTSSTNLAAGLELGEPLCSAVPALGSAECALPALLVVETLCPM